MKYSSNPAHKLSSGKFTDGDPAQGIPASIDSADHMNAVYDEIIAAISYLGLTPTEGDNVQLAEGLADLVQNIQTLIDLRATQTEVDGIQNALLGKANSNGDYSSLRARGTTASDVGLSLLRNYSFATGITNNSQLYASASSVYSAWINHPRFLGLGAAGQLAFMQYCTNAPTPLARGTITRGATYPGSHLMYSGVCVDKYGVYEVRSPSASKAFASGTWRALGHANYYGNASHIPATLFVRL